MDTTSASTVASTSTQTHNPVTWSSLPSEIKSQIVKLFLENALDQMVLPSGFRSLDEGIERFGDLRLPKLTRDDPFIQIGTELRKRILKDFKDQFLAAVLPLIQSSQVGGVHPGMKLMTAHVASDMISERVRSIAGSTEKSTRIDVCRRSQLECEILNKVATETKLRWLLRKERKKELKKLS